jgi:5-methylcytosine-specific restriction protein A
MARTVAEWVGKSDDAMPPPRVRLRIFQAHGGRCYRTDRVIRPGDKWALDHIIAIINGGKNIESNLAPILTEEHKVKTAEDREEKRKTDAMTKKVFGISRPKTPIKSAGFAPSDKPAPKIAKQHLPPRPIYENVE